MTENPDFAAALLDQGRRALAEWTVADQIVANPAVQDQFSSVGIDDLRADTEVRLAHLADAVAIEEPVLFSSQLAWSKVAFLSRDVPLEALESNLQAMRSVLRDRLPEPCFDRADRVITEGVRTLHEAPSEPPSHIEGDSAAIKLARHYLLAMLEGERTQARDLLLGAVRSGEFSVPEIYRSVIRPAHAELGRMWQMNEIGISQEHYATAGAEWIVSQLEPLAERTPRNNHTLVATSVGGDTHSLGIRMVADCFEFAGWRSFFLGASTPARDVVEAVVLCKASLVALSANLCCHARTARAVVQTIRNHPDTTHVRVFVGGRPFVVAPQLWQRIGADASAPDGVTAVELAERLIVRPNSTTL